MFELISLWIFNLLYPEKKTTEARKDGMNTAAAFFYGTSFESIGKERGRQTDAVSQEQATSKDQCDYDDWLDF